MDQRKAHRVIFERTANMMAIMVSGPCTMADVSDSGAELIIDGPIEVLAPVSWCFRLWKKHTGAEGRGAPGRQRGLV